MQKIEYAKDGLILEDQYGDWIKPQCIWEGEREVLGRVR